VKVIAGQEISLTFVRLRVHYGVYKNPSLYLVQNLCKLFVINPFVPELNVLGTLKKSENLNGHQYRQSPDFAPFMFWKMWCKLNFA
jgi:hypothetical protein